MNSDGNGYYTNNNVRYVYLHRKSTGSFLNVDLGAEMPMENAFKIIQQRWYGWECHAMSREPIQAIEL